MNRRKFIKAGALTGVSVNALPFLAGTNATVQDPILANPLAAPGVMDQTSTSTQEKGQVFPFSYPRILPTSPTFTVQAADQHIAVIQTSVGAFVAFDCEGPIEVIIETPIPIASIRIAPARHAIKPTISKNRVSFRLPQPLNLLIEIDNLEQLFLYASVPDHNAPARTDAGVHYFKAGQIYEVGEFRLKENETLYIEGGAVVRGCIRATSAKNVRIAGHGVLDGSYYRRDVDGHRSIVLEDCRDSLVEDIIMIEPSSWMIVLGASQNVTVRNVKELGNGNGTDGVDIVGSRQIRIQDCFFRNGDDCVVIKSLDLRSDRQDITLDFTRDVEDVEVTGCALLAYSGGQAFEIGHELRTNSIRYIRFRDCDILGVHDFGAPFGIHNSDHATISDVLYENICVEHHYNKLLEFRIFQSRWSKDKQRGQIRNVTLRNIEVVISIYNPGYTLSAIGGCDAEHTVEHVRFENVRLNGQAARTADDLDLYTKHSDDISFS
jgi:hypothetical protein